MKRVANEHGISLMEVLASITIFSVVAAGLGAATVGSIKSNAASKDIAAASALVQNEVEQLRALDPVVPPVCATSPQLPQCGLKIGSHSDTANPMGPLGQAGGKFTRTWTVTANTPALGLSLVVVSVTWGQPQSRTVTGATYVCASSTCS